MVTGPQRLRRHQGLHVPWADHRQQGGGEGLEAHLEATAPSIFTDASGRIANDQLSGATAETYIGLLGASLELHSVRRARASLDSSELWFWLHGQFWLQLWLQIWLQEFLRTAMFFYRFSCFISLVTIVTKKSSKSFQDRELHAISLQGKV